MRVLWDAAEPAREGGGPDVSGATSYELHVRQPPTPWGSPSPILTPFPTAVGGTPAWSTLLNLPPGDYEVAVSARNGSNTSGRSNVLALSVPTASSTATITATATPSATLTPTATRTQTPLDTPQLYDLSGVGGVTAYDAALALRAGNWPLAACILRVAVGLACDA